MPVRGVFPAEREHVLLELHDGGVLSGKGQHVPDVHRGSICRQAGQQCMQPMHPWPVLATHCQFVFTMSIRKLQREEWQRELQPVRERDILHRGFKRMPGMSAWPVCYCQHVLLPELYPWKLQRAVLKRKLQHVPGWNILAHGCQCVHELPVRHIHKRERALVLHGLS